jgi:hypothetical protein
LSADWGWRDAMTLANALQNAETARPAVKASNNPSFRTRHPIRRPSLKSTNKPGLDQSWSP